VILAKIAFRNILRHKFRNSVILLVMGLSFSILLFFRGLAEGGYEQMIEIVIKGGAGHVVIEGKGYRKKRRIDITVPEYENIVKKIRISHKNLTVVPRIFFRGTLRSAHRAVLINNIVATNPRNELKVTDIKDKIKQGVYVSSSKNEILIGSKLANLLAIEAGDSILLIATGLRGRITQKIKVCGIFHTGIDDTDLNYGVMPLNSVQKLLNMEGTVSQLALFENLGNSIQLAKELNMELKPLDLDILSWDKAVPMISQFVVYHNASIWVFQAIIFFIVSIIVMNGLLMGVLERTREFGVIKAVGMTPWKIFSLISIEAIILGFIAMIIGLGIGLSAVWYTSKYGMNPTIFTGGEAIEIAGGNFSEKIYSKLSWFTVLWTSGALIGLSFLSGVIPGIRAARLNPIKAMKKRS
jgi:putative ABC transport system permease protein